MDASVMIVYRGGKVVGPVSLDELQALRQSSNSEIDFVITREKGWIPLDTFMSWTTAAGEIAGKSPGEENTDLTSVYTYIPWKFLLSLTLIMGAVILVAWWLTR